MAPGRGIDHRAPEADRDDEDLEHQRHRVHGEVEADQHPVMALNTGLAEAFVHRLRLTSMSGEAVSARSEEFDELIVGISDELDELIVSVSDEFDDDVSDDDDSDVIRMGRRTVSQARWVRESRVAGTMQSSLPTAHLNNQIRHDKIN